MSTVGDYLQNLPPDRRVAMAKICSLIRRSARGVRESMRHAMAFYELQGPLFALQSQEKSMTLFVAEETVLEAFKEKLPNVNLTQRTILFSDLNRIPLDHIERIVRDSVTARRNRVANGEMPTQAQMLEIWGITAEAAKAPPPTVRISLKSRDEDTIELIHDTKPMKKVH
ncbi:MAG: DUF1801 domain-containing protein [Candidatus Aphodousia sp.]|nr:DUF1801 domain-containing protein [Sutterella sp.]MDY2899623.1 DUF1801 domain-containing protein [Candidatus Aphodousia sp.]